ncbi:MAG: PAS domain-containing protein [Aquabacterium sp.]|nr:PAS domain-containing protein [Aquabacterium sp.]
MPLPLPDPAEAAAVSLPDTTAFDLLPVPVAWCDGQGRWLGCNAAFADFTGQRPDHTGSLPLPGALGAAADAGRPLAVRLLQDDDADHLPWLGQGPQGQPLAARLSLRRHGSWRIVTLLPQADAPATLADAQPPLGGVADHQALLAGLNSGQQLAHFGTWTHDLRTGTRHWDAQVWRFWGRTPQAGALDLSEALNSVHPDDRAETAALHRKSMSEPGRYAHRLRVIDPSGAEHRIRALWQVQADSSGQPVQAHGIVFDDTETFRLAQSASDAQSQLNLVLALADIAIWEHEADTKLLRTSTLGWALLGLPPQPRGLPLPLVLDRLDANSRLSLQAHLGDIGAADLAAVDFDTGGDGPDDLELRCRRPDGRWRTLLTRGVRRRDAQGRALGHVGVMLDLSDRFDAQQQALALAQRLEMATAAAGVGVWSVELDNPPRVHWNAQMRQLHGLAPEAEAPMVCRYIDTHVHPADRATVQSSLDVLAKRDDGLLDMDLRIVLPAGQVRRLATRTSVHGGPGLRQLNGVVLDVTERHATEAQLRQAVERAALAARGAGIGTWESIHDADDGWWDAQMFRLRGLERPPGLVTSNEMHAWLHPADRDDYRRQMQAAQREGSPTNTEFRVVWPDGTVRWLASRSTPVRDEAGQTARRIGINWDTTDARNAQAARQERLLAQRESQAKSRFLARISHELRTPLNAVLGFAQLLLADTVDGHPPDQATWRSRVGQVQASGEHLLALIDDVLELSSLESGELPLSLQPVALAPLVQTSLPLVELLAQQHQVSLVVGPFDGWVLADPVRLRQVLLNLLSNAIKFNRPGGRVTVDAVLQGGWWLLQVADTGRGMTEAQLQHLFEPFNRLGAERDGPAGTGIGLAIVQASMQHMGGAVQVRSTAGEGSVFELALQQAGEPQAGAPAFAAGAPLPPALPVRGSSRPLLLYIEDNEVNMMIVRELLHQRPDLDFEGAIDGASGLAAARRLQPALILLDMQLPDTDGHAVLRQLRADPATAQIRCIALSANAMPEDIRIALAEGFDDYWTKPLDLPSFLRALEALFGKAPAAAA